MNFTDEVENLTLTAMASVPQGLPGLPVRVLVRRQETGLSTEVLCLRKPSAQQETTIIINILLILMSVGGLKMIETRNQK